MDIKNYLQNEIWKSKGETQPGYPAYLASALRWGYALMREIKEGGLEDRAMGLVYTTLLSMAPLLAVSFSVLKAFGIHNQLKPLLLEVLTPLGEKRTELAGTIIGFVENIQVGVLGALGLALLFYSVISLLEKIEVSFNQIWRVKASRGWKRRISDYLSVLLIGPVLVFSAMGITASMASGALVQKIIALEPFGTVYYLLGLIVPYLLIIAAFTFVYSFMPNTKVHFGAALAGGVCAGIAWKIVGWAFGAIVAESASYSAIYSGFAIVIVFMIWLYVSWMILLTGGLVAFYRQHPRYLRYKSREPRLSHKEREHLGFLLLYLIGRSYYAGTPPLTLTALADSVALPWETVSEVLLVLVDAGLLVPLHTDPESFLPARAPETVGLKEVYVALRAPSESGGAHPAPPEPALTVEDLTSRLEHSALAVLDGLSIRDLVIRPESSAQS
ncbi:MAG: ribonuclease [Proteobacteria bacterium]|nr:ribonuclease [Pseudomonadota bacterium]